MKCSKRLLLCLLLCVGACSAPGAGTPGQGEESIGSVSSAVTSTTDWTLDIGSTDAINYTNVIGWIRSQITDGRVPFFRNGATGYYRILQGRPAVGDGEADLLRLHLFWRGGSTITLLMRRDTGYIIGYVRRGHNVTDPDNTLFTGDDTFYHTSDFGPSGAQITAMTQANHRSPNVRALAFDGNYNTLTNARNTNLARNEVIVTPAQMERWADDVDTANPAPRAQSRIILQSALFFAEAARFFNIEEYIRDGYTFPVTALPQAMADEVTNFANDGDAIANRHNDGWLATMLTIAGTLVYDMWRLQQYVAIAHVGKP